MLCCASFVVRSFQERGTGKHYKSAPNMSAQCDKFGWTHLIKRIVKITKDDDCCRLKVNLNNG